MTKELYDKLIDTLFDAYCDEDNDYPEDVKAEINNTIKYFSNALHSTPAKIDHMITASLCNVERWAFEQGFHACLEIVTGSILKNPEI